MIYLERHHFFRLFHFLLYFLYPIVSSSSSSKCSIIQLRRQIAYQESKITLTATDIYDVLIKLAHAEFAMASCLEQSMPSLTDIRVKQHLEKSLSLCEKIISLKATKIQSNNNEDNTLSFFSMLYAQTLSALNKPIKARHYLRSLTLNLPSSSKKLLKYYSTVISQAEMSICSSSKYPLHLCNISSVVHYMRASVDIGLRPVLPLSNPVAWGTLFRRKGSTHRTHIVALTQKMKHDIRQSNYLIQLTSNNNCCNKNNKINFYNKQWLVLYYNSYTKVYNILKKCMKRSAFNNTWYDIDQTLTDQLDNSTIHFIQSTYNQIVHLPSLPSVHNNDDRSMIVSPRGVLLSTSINQSIINRYQMYEKKFIKSGGIVIIDDLLTKQTLYNIRKFLNEAFIYHDPRMGYIGAYGQSGVLMDPSIVMLVSALGHLFPNVLCGLPLVQIWAYKYDQSYNKFHQTNVTHSGIALHADDAQVNMNIWLTKSRTDNMKETTGGLLIYPNLKSSNNDLFSKFNQSPPTEIVQKTFMGCSSSSSSCKNKVIQVLHRSNRMVLFDSSMYHQSDGGMNTFGTKYDESRINLTLLFGRKKGKRIKKSDDSSSMCGQ